MNVSASAVPVRTVTTSVAARVIPKVNAVVEFGAKLVSYTSALVRPAAAPATRINTRAVAAVAVSLVIEIVLITAEVAAGTVYRSALLVVAGADWPSTL
jgi:hypothetical protein